MYRVFENEGQIEYGYKTLKFMVFDHEEDISVVYTSKIYMKPYFKMQTSIHDLKMRKNKKNDNKFFAIFTLFPFCNFVILLLFVDKVNKIKLQC